MDKRVGRLALWTLSLSLSIVGCDSGNDKDRISEPVETPDAGTPEPTDGAVESDAATTSTTYMGATGIGVSDLEASYKFYTEVLGMTQRYELPVPGYVNEKIMYFKDSKGSDVVLMSYIDGRPRNFKNNPVKLVFYVPSASTVIESIRARGLQILAEPTAQAAFGGAVVAFARDPDGYPLEIVEDTKLTVPYFAAAGLGVVDIEKSRSFYARILGMAPMGELIKIPMVWDELIMQHTSGKGSAVVLLHHTDGSTRNYLNVPLKTVHFVPDVRSVVELIRAEGLPILSEPMMFTVMGTNALIALARDPDGYILELVTTM